MPDSSTAPLRIAIIGDRFMRPVYFQEAIEALAPTGRAFDFRHLELDWPDTPFIHGTPGTPTAGLKEFLGEPDARSRELWEINVQVHERGLEIDLLLGMVLELRQLRGGALAGNRALKEFTTKQRAWPWGVILASHPKQSGAQSQVSRLNRQLRPILGGKRVSYVRKTMTGSGRKVYTAQIGYSSRGEANAFCNQFRALGGRCIVLKN